MFHETIVLLMIAPISPHVSAYQPSPTPFQKRNPSVLYLSWQDEVALRAVAESGRPGRFCHNRKWGCRHDFTMIGDIHPYTLW